MADVNQEVRPIDVAPVKVETQKELPGWYTGKKTHSVGLVQGPVPPEYMDTENLKAEQRAAREAESVKPTDPIMQPAIDPGSLPGQANVAPPAPDITPEDRGDINMGDMPQWTSVMQATDYRNMGKPQQNRVKEQWLRTVADLNPQYNADEIRELRKFVYQSQAEPVPFYEKDWFAKALQSNPVTAPVGVALDKKAREELKVAGNAALDVAGKIIGPPPEKGKPTSVEKAYAQFIPGMIPMQLPANVEQAPKSPGTLETAIKFWEDRGLKEGMKDVGWFGLEEAMKMLEQVQATSSFVFGGLEGKIEQDRKLARAQGHMKYLRELPEAERHKLYENVMFSEGFTGVDERIADAIREQMVPMGMTVQEIDRAIIRGIQEKKFPEQAFYDVDKIKRKGGKAAINDTYDALGYLATNAMNMSKANQAFWENLDYDTRKIRDASTLRKLTKGKTYEEKYGFWKGLAANVLLTSVADPAVWVTIGWDVLPKIGSRFAKSTLGEMISHAMSGKLNFDDTVKTVQAVLKGGGKEADEMRSWLGVIVKEMRREAEFAGKDKAKIVAQADELASEIPKTKKAATAAEKMAETAKANNVPVDEWWKKLPYEGTVPRMGEAEAAAVAGRATEDALRAAGPITGLPPEGVVPISREAAEEAAKAGRQVTPPPVGEVAAPTDVLGMSSAVGRLVPEEVANIRRAAEAAGRIPEGFADISSKLEADRIAKEAADEAKRAASAAEELEKFRQAVKAAGEIKEGFYPGIVKLADKAAQETLAEAPEIVGAFGRITDLPWKLPDVDASGVTKVDDAVEKVLDDKIARQITGQEGAKTVEQEIVEGAERLKQTAEEQRLSKLRTHDMRTRRMFIREIQKYEEAIANPATSPPARERMWAQLQREWEKMHPGEPDELTKIINERAANRRGEIVQNPTGSDLSIPMEDEWISQWSVPKGMSREELYRFKHYNEREADRLMLENAMKEFEAAGGKPTKIATHAEEQPRVVGEAFSKEARIKAMEDEGMEIFSGEEQIGRIGDRLSGSLDDFENTMKYAVEQHKQSLRRFDVEELKSAARQGWSTFSKAKEKAFNEIANTTLLGGKDKKEILKMLDNAEKEARAAAEQGTKLAGRKEPWEIELDKINRIYRNTVKREAGRTSPITAKKMSDGSVKVTRVAHGRKESSYFTPPEHNDGEYLGSIMGMAQKFWDDHLLRRAGKGARAAAAEEAQHLSKSFFSIEKRFENFPTVGRAVKDLYSKMDMWKEWGFQHMKSIAKEGKTGKYSFGSPGKHKLTSEDMINIPLYRENSELFNALPDAEKARLQPIMDKVARFYDGFKSEYAKRGADIDFKRHFEDALRTNNARGADIIKGLKDGTISYVGKKDLADIGITTVPETFNGSKKAAVARLIEQNMEANNKILGEIANFEYINIPHAMWFDSGFDKSAMLKAVRLANAQKRKTFRIQDLIDAEAIKREQVDLFDMMSAYTHRASKDLALLDIKNAMKEEGVFKKIKDLAADAKTAGKKTKELMAELKGKGWSKVDHRHFPFFSDGMLHPAMKEWLYGFKYDRLNANTFDKVLSSVKVWQFANPFFLPYYDIVQGAVARGFGALNPIGWGKDLKAAVSMYKNKSPLYWDLLYHGIDSKPMSLPFDEWTAQVNRLKGEGGGIEFLKKFGKDAGTSLGLKPIYELSWWGAWEMDKLVRFSTANYLMRKMKMNVADAARMSAILHSDYANVPMATRRGLNRVLFTGTFKVTMFRLYKDMIKNMVKVPYNLIARKGATTEEKVLAKAGYTTLLGALGGFDLFMTAKGYERDQWARRYFMPIQTEKGPKESVVVFSNPLGMIPKYAQTITKIATEDYKDDKAAQLIDEFKYDIHPVYRITTDIIRNKKADGNTIWTPFADTGAMKYAKILEYASKEVWAMFKAIGMERRPEDQQQAWEHFRKEWGDIAAYAASPTSFQYLRDPSTVKYVKELQRMQRKYRSTIEDMIEDQTYDPKKAMAMQQELVRRSQRILQLLQNAEKVHDRNVWERWKGDI